MFGPRRAVLAILLAACTPARGEAVAPGEPEAGMRSYEDALRAIARDIERLGRTYPQLRGFSVAKHYDPERLWITYEFHTHPPERSGGWAAAVPNPDPDGIWLHVDFHDPDSTAQIHTQPVMLPPLHFREKKVMFLLLQGEDTESVADAILDVLHDHGVTEGPP